MNTDKTTKGARDEEELVMDVTKMSDGQRAAMELAETSREKEWGEKSFASRLFMGTLDYNMIYPFPSQTDEEKKIGDKAVANISAYLAANLDPDTVDAAREIPAKVIKDLAAMGVFAMKIPVEYGGLGLSQVNYNRVMAMIASYCGSTAVLISAHQSIGVPQPLKVFGTPEQKKKYLPRFRQGAISAFALTEPEVGSDPARMSTTAVPTEDGKFYILNGVKQWCTNGPIADIMVVMAKTPPKIVKGRERQQITAFIIEKTFPGVETVQRCEFMGLAGMQNGLMKFTNVKVPVENIILGEGRGLKMALATLNTGRLTLPAASAGVARQCLSMVRRFSGKRIQWGQPIGRHEAGCQKLAYIASTTLAMEAVTWLASDFADRKDHDIRVEAAMAKLFCSESAWKIVDMTMQLMGGRGYEKATSLQKRGDEPFPVERIMRDIRINTIIEGTSEIMRLFIAREAMDPHFKLAGDLLKKHVPMGQKLRSLGTMAGYYGRWYPQQWLAPAFAGSYHELGSLATHMRYAEQTAHKLARTLFHAMGMYREALEKKQGLLGHLVEIGTELFAIACVCSYAVSLDATGGESPVKLADFFCRQARRRIKAHFTALTENDDKLMNSVADDVLDGKLKWQEKDIIWIGKKE